MPTQFSLLGAARVNGIMAALQDPRLLPPDLTWSRRIPETPATEDELLAKFQGFLLIADLVADDARAATYSMGRFAFESVKIPNLKMGISMNQTMLNQLSRLASGYFSDGDLGVFTSWENRTIEAALNGVRHRKEALIIAMLLDGLSYDRLGIKMTNVTFGMPSDLKVTPGTGWDNIAATPITDIQAVRRIARVRYGIDLNRLTLSSTALEYAFRTTEFQNQALTFGWGFAGIPAPAIPVQQMGMLTTMMERIISGAGGRGDIGDPAGGFRIEVDDRRYWFQNNAGLIQSAPFLPITKALLTDSRNDGNRAAYDFGNAICTETIVGSTADIGIIGGFAGPEAGPVSYVTGTHNSPSLTYWGVQRGFPRKHMLQSSAALTVGNFADIVSVGVPFPA